MEIKKKRAYITAIYTLVCGLFIALSVQFFGAIFPILMILPIFMGLNGLKYGKKSGFYLALGILPLGFAVAILWINYFLSIINNFNSQMINLSREIGISLNVITTLNIIAFILSIILLILSVITFISLIKNKNLFNK
ncbi:MAG: hypothetical protein ACERKV_08510 [Clostridiaceae bacterium]